MKIIRSLVFTTLFFLCSGLPSIGFAESVAQEPVTVAKVGNMAISQADIDLRAQKLLPMQVSFHGAIDAEKIASIKQSALDELITRAYQVQYAIDEEISIEAAVFENNWQKILSKNPQLAEYSKTPQYTKLKADLYIDLLSARAETVAVDEKIVVTEDEVATYYAEHREKYFRPKLFTASHVFVKVDPSDNTEEKEIKSARADALYARAKAGEDFYNLAYYESDDRSKYVGGSLGSFHAGQMIAELDAAIQNMIPGEVAGPVRTMYGFHVIKLDKIEDERQLQFDEVSTKIRATLVESARILLYEKWMSQLKGKYPLELISR